MRVAIIEDDDSLRYSLSLYLSILDKECLAVSHTDADRAFAYDPELLILDVVPWRLVECATIVTKFRERGVKIALMCSALPYPECDFLLKKPFDLSDLDDMFRFPALHNSK